MATTLWSPLGGTICRARPRGTLHCSKQTFCCHSWLLSKSLSSPSGAVSWIHGVPYPAVTHRHSGGAPLLLPVNFSACSLPPSDLRSSAGNSSCCQTRAVLRDEGPKKLFILEYDYVSDYLTRREEHRQAHLQLVHQYADQGKILLAGPHSPPKTAIFIFQVDTLEEVETFVLQDPYKQSGIVARSSAREWHVVAGSWKGLIEKRGTAESNRL